jgi:Zn-dependent M28 family amino/carboxypeptidase
MRLILAAALAAATLCASPALAESQALKDVRILSADDMQGRLIGSPGGAKARAYLLTRLKAVGVTPFGAGFEQPFTAERKGKVLHGVNLVGQIPGSEPGGPVIVVTAHYDHLGVRDGQVFNGADDNASGVAGLLAVAEDLKAKPPRHTVILALVDGEEGGDLGSRWFVDHPPLPLSRVALNVNFDMLSKTATGELYASGAYHFPWLKPRLDRLAADVPVILKQGHDGPPWTGEDDWTSQSDHFAFHEKGVPWVYFGVEDHPEYHRPTDDAATIPAAFFDRAVETVTKAVRMFDADLDAVAAEGDRRRP